MSKFKRLTVSRSAEVSVSAADYWSALRKWDALLEWMPKESPPTPIMKCELKPGHSIDRLPCTRVLYIDRARLQPDPGEAAVPSLLQETVLYADQDAGFLCYTLDQPMPYGMRNYIAFTEVDDIAPDRARVTNTGRVDIPHEIPSEAVVTLMGDTYERAIIHGIAAYATRLRATR